MSTRQDKVRKLRLENAALTRQVDRLLALIAGDHPSRGKAVDYYEALLSRERRASEDALRSVILERDGYKKRLRQAVGTMEDAREMVGEREG
jgi:hypothetical protein